ncbi:MAG: Cof-type HAD-IIB family hydrolase [Lachnospiraceae bacterium]
MDYKIIVLDIDGTLTNSKKEISPETLQALLEIQERGFKVAVASGRPTPGVRGVAEELKLAKYGNYVLSFNGARIMNYQTKEIVYQKTMSAAMAATLKEDATEYGVGMLTYDEDGAIAATPVDSYMEIEARINRIAIKQPENFAAYVNFPVNKCLMTGEPEHLVKVEAALKQKYHGLLNIFRSEPYFLELMPMGIDKAATLAKLLQLLGLSADQMICCGDGFNDITMIEYAGLGVAMANAREEVLAAADYVTASNDENGILQVIQKFIL